MEFIRTKKSCASPKNKVTVVFDGYSAAVLESRCNYSGIDIVFSKDISADEKIKAMLEKAANPRLLIVVSDDKEVKFFARSAGAKAAGVEEFIAAKTTQRGALRPKGKLRSGLLKPELTYVEMSKINRELRDLWLK